MIRTPFLMLLRKLAIGLFAIDDFTIRLNFLHAPTLNTDQTNCILLSGIITKAENPPCKIKHTLIVHYCNNSMADRSRHVLMLSIYRKFYAFRI